ncbi:allantoicase [Antrihabitans cavernicola]|uniref:Probable allantoicase n=1 Tax=Antrihabitans cavernicola TaxID=2495913 RepID=A0A5A7S9E4_9NOCA|nr:allantoicase [Spelaeibacter cavernicola]KAA0021772.1 allantoicase [Spelaeibacter cavernicola]
MSTTDLTNLPDFAALPDLASRALGGSVSAANDELFAERENLIKATAPYFDPNEFGHKGKVYDGWETRRRRDEGHDYAIVRLGAAGVIHGVIVDTAYFKGNYPPFVSVEAASIEGYPSPEEILKADWQTIVAKSPAEGHTANAYEVTDKHRWTHVRLCMYPDGGIARLRVHGEVVPDPRFLGGTVDLLAAENGGRLVDCSDAFYASPANIILPGRARNMGEGWENSRRRGGGNDFAVFSLAAAGVPKHVEVDTSYYVGNAPGWVSLSTVDARTADIADASAWVDLLPRTAVQPDTRHRFVLDASAPATHLRLDVYPDGGLSRLRLFGALDDKSATDARRTWWDALPQSHQAVVADQAPR